MSKFALWKEARGYSVWSRKEHTGDKLDCYGFYNSKREAFRALQQLRRFGKLAPAKGAS